jgi:hypothetical protein
MRDQKTFGPAHWIARINAERQTMLRLPFEIAQAEYRLALLRADLIAATTEHHYAEKMLANATR